MKNLNKLRQNRAEKARLGKDKETAINALLAKTTLTDAEQAQLTALEAEADTLEAEVTAIDQEIAAEEKRARRAQLFGTTAIPVNRSIVVNDLNPATTGGFHNLADFAISARNAVTGMGTDPRLTALLGQGSGEMAAAPSNFHQNGGSAGEGYLVPTEYRDRIWDLAFPEHDLLRFCSPEPTNSNAIGLAKDETTPWGSSGVQAAWRSEASQMNASKLAVSGELVQLHELYAFVGATNELLSDAPRLNAKLTSQSARAINWKASEAVMWGDGVGKPLGFLKSNAKIVVAKENAQAAATLLVMNLANMLARVLEAGGVPMWIANRDVLPQLIGLTIGNVPAWLPNNAPVVGGPGGTLFGYPVYFNEHAQTLGTEGDISCVDLMGYALLSKAGAVGIEFASSIHLWFDLGMSAFRWTFRIGGQPYLSKPVQPAKGATTKSHFVTLATRA